MIWFERSSSQAARGGGLFASLLVEHSDCLDGAMSMKRRPMISWANARSLRTRRRKRPASRRPRNTPHSTLPRRLRRRSVVRPARAPVQNVGDASRPGTAARALTAQRVPPAGPVATASVTAGSCSVPGRLRPVASVAQTRIVRGLNVAMERVAARRRVHPVAATHPVQPPRSPAEQGSPAFAPSQRAYILRMLVVVRLLRPTVVEDARHPQNVQAGFAGLASSIPGSRHV